MRNITFLKTISLLPLLTLVFCTPNLLADTAEEIRAQMPDAAVNINKTLPKMIDEVTRLEKAAYNDRILSYSNTIVSATAEEMDSQKFYDIMLGTLSKTLCTNENTKALLDANIIFLYTYVGKEKRLISDVVITKHTCK